MGIVNERDPPVKARQAYGPDGIREETEGWGDCTTGPPMPRLALWPPRDGVAHAPTSTDSRLTVGTGGERSPAIPSGAPFRSRSRKPL